MTGAGDLSRAEKENCRAVIAFVDAILGDYFYTRAKKLCGVHLNITKTI